MVQKYKKILNFFVPLHTNLIKVCQKEELEYVLHPVQRVHCTLVACVPPCTIICLLSNMVEIWCSVLRIPIVTDSCLVLKSISLSRSNGWASSLMKASALVATRDLIARVNVVIFTRNMFSSCWMLTRRISLSIPLRSWRLSALRYRTSSTTVIPVVRCVTH